MRIILIFLFFMSYQLMAEQTHCYDTVKEIPCGSKQFPRQEGDYAVKNKAASFSLTQPGIILDKRTGLRWMQCTLGANLHDCNNPAALTWEAAEQACSANGLLQLQWRLATVVELNSLIELEHQEVKIDTDFFPDTQKSAYWTGVKSLTYKTQGNRAWFIHFSQASILDASVNSKHFVRCVSGG